MSELTIDSDNKNWVYSGHGRHTLPYDECPHCGTFNYSRGEIFVPKGIWANLMSMAPSTPAYVAERYNHKTLAFEFCENCRYETSKYNVPQSSDNNTDDETRGQDE